MLKKSPRRSKKSSRRVVKRSKARVIKKSIKKRSVKRSKARLIKKSRKRSGKRKNYSTSVSTELGILGLVGALLAGTWISTRKKTKRKNWTHFVGLRK